MRLERAAEIIQRNFCPVPYIPLINTTDTVESKNNQSPMVNNRLDEARRTDDESFTYLFSLVSVASVDSFHLFIRLYQSSQLSCVSVHSFMS